MFEQKFKITNLNCSACVTLSREALLELPGVSEFSVDPLTGEASLKASRQVDWPEIQQALSGVGKDAIQLT